ncbi:MAG: baseplate J/gp47 family protein [Peptococcaceae bacterium]|nr:baseplate J/gp47 family protein [Candidatus Syntrophopropionicum ammoniitolerans]
MQENEEAIHRRMLEKAPPGISTREGDFFWDATRPTATEVSEVRRVLLVETLRLALPQYSYGAWLRLLGALRGVWEREALKAKVTITIEAAPGTVIPAGAVAVAPAEADRPAIEFIILEKGNVTEAEAVDIEAEAIEPGVKGNVAAGTIIALKESIDGVFSITNLEAATGGTDIEDDDSFRERMLYSYQDPPLSGAKSDYERWALEVSGVGGVFVEPLWDGPGTVKVMILDASGTPGGQALVDRVQQYIAPDGRNGGGVAPIGALVTVTPPDIKEINISYTPIMEEEFAIDSINDKFKKALQQYYTDIGAGGVIRFNKVSAILTGIDGIKDHSGLLVNDVAENIQLSSTEVAVSGVVEANE